MYTDERFDAIIQYLKENKRATVAQMSKLLYVSEATVRRDLMQMEKLGLLKRTHGGAVFSEATDEVSIHVRQTENAREKEAAAAVALQHIPDFETVFVDNSSTSLALISRMNFRHKVVVTSGFQIANELLKQEGVRILMPGGELHSNTGLTGGIACRALREFHFDLMLCSCAALSPDGAFEKSLAAREIKLTALERSEKVILIADSTKLLHKAPYRTCGLNAFDAICTDAPETAALTDAGGKVFCPK